LLVATWQALCETAGEPDAVALLAGLRASDVDADAVEVARDAFAAAVAATIDRWDDPSAVARAALDAISRGIRVEDGFSTLAAMPRPARVITNPPFVSARRLHRAFGGEAVRRLRMAHPECHGAFDLGVPMIARALDATQGDGGALAFVAPAAWQTADYASALRQRLGARRWARVRAERRPFGAAVDVVTVASPPPDDRCPFHWSRPEMPDGFVPLSDVAEVWAGTPGFEARATAAALVESGPNIAPGWRFVTSGVVGEWSLRERPARFMGTTWQRPHLPRAAVRSAARRERYDRPVWLVPGVAAELRAAWSPAPAALGVGVLAVATSPPLVSWIGAVLNAPSTSNVWRAMHPGAALSNGYLRLSVGLLSSTPVPDPNRLDVAAVLDQLDALVPRAVQGDAEAAAECIGLIEAMH
jgi:hypothetical protein